MSMIDWGMQFMRDWRKTHLSATASITHSGGFLPSVPATRIEPGFEISGQGVRVKTDHFIFQIDVADVPGVTWKRGCKITFQGSVYEVIKQASYDDPTHMTYNIPAKLIS